MQHGTAVAAAWGGLKIDSKSQAMPDSIEFIDRSAAVSYLSIATLFTHQDSLLMLTSPRRCRCRFPRHREYQTQKLDPWHSAAAAAAGSAHNAAGAAGVCIIHDACAHGGHQAAMTPALPRLRRWGGHGDAGRASTTAGAVGNSLLLSVAPDATRRQWCFYCKLGHSAQI